MLIAEMKNIIQAAEKWFYRRMLQISYTKHITNTEVLNHVQQDRQSLLNMTSKRQLKFLGQWIHH